MLSAAAREIGAGRLDQRVEPQSNDEFGSLVEAFNCDGARAGGGPPQGGSRHDPARAQARRGRRTAPLHRDDPRAHRHRASSRSTPRARSRRSTPPRRACSASIGRSSGSRRWRCSIAPICSRSARCWPAPAAAGEASRRPTRSRWRARVRSCTWPPSRRSWSATAARSDGVVLVLDDVTPLIRAQKVAAWREVARRLAHEIKNPLTPIQLSAERLRRHFASAPPQTQALVDECTHDHRRRSRVAERARSTSSRSSRGCRRRARCRPTWLSSSPTRSRSTTASSPTSASTSGSRRACRSSGSTPSRSGG